ncbi:MAG TPA: hypothetical protein VG325_16825 [Solirubrobacteraceae bacterium]|jgi:hypothetical protein|nr:hypothetical protein [Solirubrobacteraceae bacterium]
MVRAHRRSALRGLAQVGLLPPAALGVHELRYLLAFGPHAGLELQRQGHSYLHSVVPWLAVVVSLVAGGFLRALGRAFSGRTSTARLTTSFAALWLACTACLLMIYVGQESLEGLFAPGHSAGWIGIFGYGGWWSIPAAACIGLVLAAVYHGADWVLSEVSRRYASSLPRTRRRIAQAPRPPRRALPRPAPVAGGWSGRGPPASA